MQVSEIMRANRPSFFVCLGLSFCISVAASHDYLGLWLGICCLLIAWVISPNLTSRYSLSALALISLFFLICIDLIISNYHEFPVAYFIVSYGLLGFFVTSVIEKKQLVSIFRIIVIIFCLLSAWSLVQYFFSYGKFESHGISAGVIFANANSYGASVNLILLPLISVYLIRLNSKSNYLYFVILLLFSSLIATQSRGAWVAFTIGLSFMVFLLVLNNNYRFNIFKKLIYGFILVFILVSGSKLLVLSIPLVNGSVENNYAVVLKDNIKSAVAYKGKSTLEHRKDLALIAWKNIKQNPLIGIGYYNTIYIHYKDIKDLVYTKTHYIHNDYMQIWLELGLLGIILLLFTISTVYWQGIKSLKNVIEEDGIWIIAILSGLTTMFVHALVSYVFYVPTLIFLASAYVAALNIILIRNKDIFIIDINSISNNKNIFEIKTGFKRLIISFVIIIGLFSFVFSQISFRAGELKLREGSIEKALMLFELAREFSPSEVDGYLVEARYWTKLAFEESNPEAAERADKLYEELMASNKYDATSRLERAVLHRDGFMYLSEPASRENIFSWLEYALNWRPHHNILQAEYLRTLKKYGKIDEARILFTKYIKMYPKSNSLANVREEITLLD